MTMYQRIRDLRIQHGMSQQQLAKLTGYQDRSSIAKIESGFVDLPQSKILQFSKVLQVSPAYLMGLEDESCASSQIVLTPRERIVVIAYRAHPEMQDAVDRLLQIESETVSAKNA